MTETARTSSGLVAFIIERRYLRFAIKKELGMIRRECEMRGGKPNEVKAAWPPEHPLQAR
jgi:hypothetical protein